MYFKNYLFNIIRIMFIILIVYYWYNFYIEERDWNTRGCEEETGCLSTCDKRWIDSKSRFVSRWITKTRKGPNNYTQPYVLYPFIM